MCCHNEVTKERSGCGKGLKFMNFSAPLKTMGTLQETHWDSFLDWSEIIKADFMFKSMFCILFADYIQTTFNLAKEVH